MKKSTMMAMLVAVAAATAQAQYAPQPYAQPQPYVQPGYAQPAGYYPQPQPMMPKRLTVAVFDFTIPTVSVRDYQNENYVSPLENPPAPLIDPQTIDRLPEEDRLAIMRKEQDAKEEWLRKKREIEVERYNERMEANSKVRDVLLKTEDGRTVIQGVGIMEAALSARSDVFELFKPVTADKRVQRNYDLAAAQGEIAPTDAKVPEAPEYYVEGEVGDLDSREVSSVSGPVTVHATFYRLPVTIKLFELGTGRMLGVYSEEVATRDQAAGFAPKSRQEIMQGLLRQAAKAAADQFAAICQPLVYQQGYGMPMMQPQMAPAGYAPMQPQMAPAGYAPVQPQMAPAGYVPVTKASVCSSCIGWRASTTIGTTAMR